MTNHPQSKTQSRGARRLSDPWAAVLQLGEGQLGRAFGFGLVAALSLHGALAQRGLLLSDHVELRNFATAVQIQVYSKLVSTLDIEIDEPPPPPPEPEPEVVPEAEEKVPEPPPTPPPPPPEAPKEVPKAAPPKAAAPAAAQAAKVLTAPADPNEPLDLTGDGFVQGTADSYAGGYTATTGKSKVAVKNPGAKPSGVVGGTGTATKPAVVVQGPDLSRPASPNSALSNCGFPPEADAEGINYQQLQMLLVIDEQGKAVDAKVLKDPGFGFAARAKRCAKRLTHRPALNRSGKPMRRSITFLLTFRR